MASISLVPGSTASTASTVADVARAEDDQRVARLYQLAKSWANGRAVTAASIVTFATYLISASEQLVTEGHAGAFKKQAVLTVLRNVVANDIVFKSQDDREAVLGVVELVVPMLIDTIIGVATGSIDIGKIFGSASCCCFGGKPAASAAPAAPAAVV